MKITIKSPFLDGFPPWNLGPSRSHRDGTTGACQRCRRLDVTELEGARYLFVKTYLYIYTYIYIYCQLASGFYSNTTSTRKLRPRSNFPQRTPRAKQPFHGFVEPGRPRPKQPTVWRQRCNPPTAQPARLSHTPLEHSSLGPGRIILTGVKWLLCASEGPAGWEPWHV